MMGIRAVASSPSPTVRFGRQMTAAEFKTMRPLLDGIAPLAALGEYEIKPEFCATMAMPKHPWLNILKVPEALADTIRMNWNVRNHWKKQAESFDFDSYKPYAVKIQQVTIPQGSKLANKGDTWELSNPCTRNCKLLASGKPASGRAIKSHTMIN